MSAVGNAVASVNMNAARGTAMAIAQAAAQAGGATPGHTRFGIGTGYYSGATAFGLGVTSVDATRTQYLSLGTAMTPGASNFSIGLSAKWSTGRRSPSSLAAQFPAVGVHVQTANPHLHEPTPGDVSSQQIVAEFRKNGFSEFIPLSPSAAIANDQAYRLAFSRSRFHGVEGISWHLWIERLRGHEHGTPASRWLSAGTLTSRSQNALFMAAKDLIYQDSASGLTGTFASSRQ